MLVKPFYDYALERHNIYLRRRAGLPRAEWTSDPILQTVRFCNVFRELDTTTIWFRENVRDPYRTDLAAVLLATTVFRLFNRITTGEAIFVKTDAFERFLVNGRTHELRDAIIEHCGDGPYITGSYIIRTEEGYSKLDGVLKILENFYRGDWHLVADIPGHSLQTLHTWFKGHRMIGDFTAYELVTDLRYTPVLDNAPDILTWANPGPGATRGLNVIYGRYIKANPRKDLLVKEMQDLLALRDTYWPTVSDDYPAWDMRTVEHTLCEYRKYCRGSARQKFKPMLYTQ